MRTLFPVDKSGPLMFLLNERSTQMQQIKSLL